MTALGVVVIGRNEAPRLAACLRSVMSPDTPVVYVDSASSDSSVAIARAAGCLVYELDAARPLSAGRARNEGFEQLLLGYPDLSFVQFVDGDCEVHPGWFQAALGELNTQQNLAIVCGRVREKHRSRSLYNRLCDIEFNRPPGETTGCGGIFVARAAAFKQVGGFDPEVVAGEEAELCLRLRRLGHHVRRISAEMALHDSAMLHFAQWWRRTVRTGHAYAQAAFLHGASAERHGVRHSMGVWAWAIGPVAAAGTLAWATSGWSMALLLLYPLQALRTALRRRVRGDQPGDRWLYGLACVASKWPELVGQLKFMVSAVRGRKPTILEHKLPGNETARVHANAGNSALPP